MPWLWTVLLCPLAGSSAEGYLSKEMIGILGEDTTFFLENPDSFYEVFWFRNDAQVAFWRRGPPCQLKKLREYTSREVTVSQDCSSLTVRGLREEDSAGYKAQILRNDEVIASQTFILKVYKRLSEADLKVVCAREILKDGNEIVHLNCSVGQWEDGVEYSWMWTSSGQGGKISSGKSLVLLFYNPQDDDRNVTCMVKNPVGKTTRTVTLKQTCAGEHLSEADLKVVCAREILKDGNEIVHLNCSVGQWEDGVEYSWMWTSSGQGGKISSGKSLVLLYNPQDDDQNVTCMVKNPVGNTSRTVSLKQTCASGNTDDPSRLSSEAAIGVTIAALIVAKVIISGCVFAKWPSCTKLTAQS